MRRVAIVLLLLAVGCVQPVLREATIVERAVGTSGASALNGVAEVTTRCGELVAALTSTVEEARPAISRTLSNIDSATYALASIQTKADQAVRPEFFMSLLGGIIFLIVLNIIHVLMTVRRK